jgi:hypothetical protein
MNTLRADIITTNNKANEIKVSLKNLIKICENLMKTVPRKEDFKFKPVSKDFEDLVNLNQNFFKKWDQDISKMITKCEPHNLLPLTEFYNATVQ